MKRRRVTVDTRRYSRGGKCPFDGFVHWLPRAKASLHEITMHCWCDPKVFWPENGVTLFVVHQDTSPEEED